ncbi:methionine--tRNA ligase [Bosea sp. (in: a-proteobacteria)]|uniref:methionine--tRNA ligase n=1 Tax=Bosea sp. (in: a-proteobacteria) TaxID=1871050 RepID=UPI0012149BA6|nr:methionine--tRNA ligase [Bosea sp. (in: a-proteobacteria)]TAJ33302.1 MAG: methionine--tRNA ligase [Bosea sp. (in: a-proteobacteria)]
MATAPKFYLTTAIHYTNGPPHIGHAYEMVAADAIARFKRLDGYDVYAQTGTDEHGQKVQRTAEQNGLSPKAFVDQIAARFAEMEKALGCSFDRFIRTTDADHKVSTDELWRRMEANGDIYLAKYSGWYSVRDEAFYGEEETTLQPDGTRLGGQGTPVEWVEEESYFFRLAKYQDALLKLYEGVPNFVSPETRRNEVVSFVKSGLEDLSISRTTFDWGLPVPGNPKHVMYVWVDALNNYLTGTGFPDPESPRAHYWPADVHIIGKDIVRFHTVYWPAFLMSAGLPLPKRVFGHGFLLNKGTKMSKSLGNVVDPFALAETYGVDPLRYFFLREVSFGQDGNYSHEAIVGRINADLANDLGNLAQRSLSMIAKNCEGRVPSCGALTPADEAMLAMADGALAKAREAMTDFALHTLLAEIWAVVAEANRYFAANEPWRLSKSDPARRDTVLYVTIEVIRQVAILVQPVMPASAGKLLDLLAVSAEGRSFAALGAGHRLVIGTELPAPSGVFPRYVEPEDGKAA